MTNIFKSVILGIVQGLSEFLPISSSGHLILFRYFMNLELPVIFDIYLHLATVFVIIVYFQRRILELFLTSLSFFLRKTTKLDLENLRLSLLILVTTCITGLVGFLINKNEKIFTLSFVLINLVLTGILLLILDLNLLKVDLKNNVFLTGISIGLMQGIGVFPGISRSGITIFAAISLGFSKKQALEISFLALIPIAFGGLFLKYKELLTIGIAFNNFEMSLGALVAFIVGIFAINSFLEILINNKLYYFSLYLFVLSSIVYLFL